MPIKELRVDLEPGKQSADIRAKRHVLNKVLQGNWNTLLKGEGMEFAGFRTYTFEDDASLIDWKATLRSDEILVREFEEYKNINVYIMLDVSNTMLFSSQEKLKAEYGAELTFALCDSILKSGDAVGMTMFTNHFVVNLPPNIGSGAYFSIRRELENPKNYGGQAGIKDVLKYINATVKEKALIIMISDFIGLEKGWQKYIDILSQRMDIIGIMLRDPRDKHFPEAGGQFMLQDPHTGQSMLIDTKAAAKMFREDVIKEEVKIHKAFSKTNSGFVSLTAGNTMYDELLSFFYKRRRLVEI